MFSIQFNLVYFEEDLQYRKPITDEDVKLEKFNEKGLLNVAVDKVRLTQNDSTIFLLFFVNLSQDFPQAVAVIEVGVDKVHFHFFLFLLDFVELLHLVAAEVEIPPEAEVRLPSELLFDDFSQPEIDEDGFVSLAADAYIFRLQIEVNDVKVVKDFHKFDQIIPIELLQIIEFYQCSHFSHGI